MLEIVLKHQQYNCNWKYSFIEILFRVAALIRLIIAILLIAESCFKFVFVSILI